MHRLPPSFLERTIKVFVIGCGGNGSAVASGLVYLHHALIARGHPGGLDVTVADADTVSPANCVRQPFSTSDVGLNKAIVLVSRINAFWGLEWKAKARHLSGKENLQAIEPTVVIGCVDTRAARVAINAVVNRSGIDYWLDLGNRADDGQYVLGQPAGTWPETPRRLRTAAELWPELIDPALDDDQLPSCSALEALTRQAPFVNQLIANHGLALLSRLLFTGSIDHHGGFVNLKTGRVAPLPVPHPAAIAEIDRREIRMAAAHGCPAEVLQEAFGIDEFEYRRITHPRRRRAA